MPEVKDTAPATDPQVEADRLVAITTELVKYAADKNFDMAEYRAEDLVSQALRVRRATIMLREKK